MATTAATPNQDKISAALDAIASRMTALTLEQGELTLKAELGDSAANDQLAELANELRVARERQSALINARNAAIELDDRNANTAALAERDRRLGEVRDLVRSLSNVARKADLSIKDFARHSSEIVELRRLLAEYPDVHHQSLMQLDPGWSFGAAIAATGRLIAERCDLSPVAYLSFSEQTESLAKQFATPRSNDPAKTAKGA